MSTQEPSKESPPNSFVCDCEEYMRHACARDGFYKEKEGKRYCVLHYPGDEKVADFRIALNNKLAAKNCNFNGVWFPKGVSFKELHLAGSANFSSASFNDYIDFSDVEFRIKALFNNARFNAGVDFSRVTFSAGADFRNASFSKDTHFGSTRFRADAHFGAASFSEIADFRDASFSLKADFGSVRFSGNADFRDASFSLKADFSSARFSADAVFSSASFEGIAVFHSASFSGKAVFSSARFNADAGFIFSSFSADAFFISSSFIGNANFNSARFRTIADLKSSSFNRNADFRDASFSGNAYFSSVSFSGNAYFGAAIFSAVADFGAAIFSADAFFENTTFKDYVYFEGQPKRRAFCVRKLLTFQSAIFEKPDHVSFHTLDLKPHWFVNVDSRKFVFTDVEFNYDLKDELERLKKGNVSAPHRLLSIACRQLADNAETDHRYHEASRLRYSSFEARRLERFYGLSFWRLDWWYWAASGYGERVLRAFIIFVVLISLCAIGYKQADFDPTSKTAITKQIPSAASSSPGIPDTQPRRLGWRENVLYSFNVSILQKPDPKPIGLWGNALVSLETVLGPAQAALLALALRRRFMR